MRSAIPEADGDGSATGGSDSPEDGAEWALDSLVRTTSEASSVKLTMISIAASSGVVANPRGLRGVSDGTEVGGSGSQVSSKVANRAVRGTNSNGFDFVWRGADVVEGVVFGRTERPSPACFCAATIAAPRARASSHSAGTVRQSGVRSLSCSIIQSSSTLEPSTATVVDSLSRFANIDAASVRSEGSDENPRYT